MTRTPLAAALALLVTLAPNALTQPARTMTYPQLIANRYPTNSPLPADVKPPAPKFDFVELGKLPAGAKILSAAKAKNGVVWAITDRGPFRSDRGQYIPLEDPRIYKRRQPETNSDTSVRAVVSDGDGHIWAATSSGLYATDGDQWWQHFDRRDGMPIEDMTCLHLAPNGDIWGGTGEGAWRLRVGKYRYFRGKRWLPGNKVTAIWTGTAGKTWIQTDGGLGCIEEKAMTLAEKAKTFNDLTQKHNNRRGYINELNLQRPGDISSGVFDVSDNDGLWNGIYVGAMCFRYAATRDPEAKAHAKQSLEAMLELERLSGISGYPARAVVTDEEIKAGVTGVDFKDTVRVPGETDPIWFRSPVEKNVWCKGDTSSDELDGHYFAWYLYHKLVADAEEKKKIAGVVRRVTDNIIAGGYNLIGHTGRKTRFGVFGPKFLNDDPYWWEERPINSLEMLSYLKLAAHVTGDKKYTQHYDELIQKHHYLLNTLLIRRGYFGQWESINHSDDEMLYMAYYLMLNLEKVPQRRTILLHSFAGTWEPSEHEKTLKGERSPLYNFLYGALTGQPCAPDEAIETLQDWPWDRMQWAMKNSHRDDVTFERGQGLNSRKDLNRVLSIAERELHRWNHNPWQPDGGSDGASLDDGAAWLLGYWAGVYHGYIPKEK